MHTSSKNNQFTDILKYCSRGAECRFADYGAPYHGTAGDDDYNDVLILVDMKPLAPLSVNNQAMGPAAVPEPATLTLVVAGFAGIVMYGRRKRG